MKIYLTRVEHDAAGDYGEPVKFRGQWYSVSQPPIFELLRNTASIEAMLLPNVTSNVVE